MEQEDIDYLVREGQRQIEAKEWECTQCNCRDHSYKGYVEMKTGKRIIVYANCQSCDHVSSWILRLGLKQAA